jgi:hypothetical protein
MSERTAEQVTVATINDLVEHMLKLPPYPPLDNYQTGHAAGYRSAMEDVKAILDMNGRPPGEPVIFEP